MNLPADRYQAIYPHCRRILGKQTWGRILAASAADSEPGALPEFLQQWQQELDLPPFIADLARIERACHDVKKDKHVATPHVSQTTLNPTLKIVPVAWKNLLTLMTAAAAVGKGVHADPDIFIAVWRHPKSGRLHLREADQADLLALKITVENITPGEAAAHGQADAAVIQAALRRAVKKGLLQAPASLIRRETASSKNVPLPLKPFVKADIFTLQWHITQACDLHCRHCYDRSERDPMPLETALGVLDDFDAFCRQMQVSGQVTFTGGNPLLYPHFNRIYRAAAGRGFGVAILGNPSPMGAVEKLLNIARPLFFQVSLEGLAPHNNVIRGAGHFERTLDFLDQLRSLNIYTMVMLTLSRDNIDQVLPLADLLRDRADHFTFNRLATVGEGARLAMASPAAFRIFLRQYEACARENPLLGLKDNLLNLIRCESGQALCGGCTGFGCGAAFNFVALLPDGEVHACRKFPSLIGNVHQSRLIDIYHSRQARRYRNGSQSCRDCPLNLVCRGCMAVAYSLGLDVFKDRDPFCFVTPEIQQRVLAQRLTNPAGGINNHAGTRLR